MGSPRHGLLRSRWLQLMPELAADIGGASLVVLVDADHGQPAGKISVTNVDGTTHAEVGWSHHFSPPDLLGLTRDLCGSTPEVLLVSAGVSSTDVGDLLSPAVAAALPQLVDTVAALICGVPRKRWSHNS